MSQLKINNLSIYYAKELTSPHYYIFVWDTENKLEFKIKNLSDSVLSYVIEEYGLSDEDYEKIASFVSKNVILKHFNNRLLD